MLSIIYFRWYIILYFTKTWLFSCSYYIFFVTNSCYVKSIENWYTL